MRLPSAAVAMVWVLLAGGSAAATEPVVAVLGSETGPYREALAGLQEGLAAPAQIFILSKEEPRIAPATRVVVAFGSKAALETYPRNTAVIYALGSAAKSPGATEIGMMPEPAELLAGLGKVQPGLKRLGVLWRCANFADYAEQLRRAGGAAGIAVERAPLRDASDIPDRLRGLQGRVEAIWLPPDPLLLSADTLPVFVEFAYASRIALFVPTAGLVEQGAVAFVGPTFRDMGRAAAAAASKVLAGAAPAARVYPDRAEIVINRTAAARIGLKVPEETLRQARQVLP